MRRTHRITAGIGSLFLAAAGERYDRGRHDGVARSCGDHADRADGVRDDDRQRLRLCRCCFRPAARCHSCRGTSSGSTLVHGRSSTPRGVGAARPRRRRAEQPLPVQRRHDHGHDPDSAVTSDSVNGRTVVVAALPASFVGASALDLHRHDDDRHREPNVAIRRDLQHAGRDTNHAGRPRRRPDPAPRRDGDHRARRGHPLTAEAVTAAQVGGMVDGNVGVRATQGSRCESTPVSTDCIRGPVRGEQQGQRRAEHLAVGATTATGKFVSQSSAVVNAGLVYALSYLHPRCRMCRRSGLLRRRTAPVSVAFTGPAFNGGSTITGFTATCSGTGGPYFGTNTVSPVW